MSKQTLASVLILASIISLAACNSNAQDAAGGDEPELARTEEVLGPRPLPRPQAVETLESARRRMLEALLGVEAASTENFVFAFMEAGATSSVARIHVRWSENGLEWENGNFPALTGSSSTLLGTTNGVGGTAQKDDGVFQWIFFDKPNAIVTVWGLGPAIWDSSGTVTPAGKTSSAPVAIDLGGDLRLIAFQQDGRVVAKIYDHNSRSFLFDVSLERGSLNSGVAGRPSIVSHSDGRILIAWRRFVGGTPQIVTAIGKIQPPFNLPVFPPAQINAIDLPSTEFTTIDSNPAVSHRGDEFILAVNREKRSTGSGEGDSLHGWRTLIYSSTDGVNWAEHSMTSLLSPVTGNLINIAARSDGRMVMANIRKGVTGNVVETATLYSDQSGTWQWDPLTKSALWGDKEASFKQFALYSYKPPR